MIIKDSLDRAPIQVDDQGYILVKDIKEWVEHLAPSSCGLYVQDVDTGAKYNIQLIEDNQP